MTLPKLATKGAFEFHDSTKNNLTDEYRQWLNNETAIQIITNILKIKYLRTGKNNRIYLLEARTGSGKSTLMVSSLYDTIVKNSKGKLICSQPRVVLTESNANEVLKFNPKYKMGIHMGIQSSVSRIIPSERESMNYCTTQILSDNLIRLLNLTDVKLIKRRLSRIKLVIVDEVHTLDLPMMSVLKVIQDVLNKYGNYIECPMFIFSSATIDIAKLIKYYFNDPNILSDPLTYGYVGGSANYDVNEHFLSDSQIKEYNIEENTKNMRDYCFELMAKYIHQNIYPKLFNSKSFYNNVQCRDCLVFVPLTSGIETMSYSLLKLIKDRPVFAITRGMTMDAVTRWRNKNKNKSRILIVGFARDFSFASDFILATSMDIDKESLKNETKIFISTGILETGKTIATLYWCIDMGLETTTINHPLSMDYSNPLKYLKQIPANVNQTIQRMGRVGRLAPGNYLHFYSEDIYKKFQKSDTAQTINSSNLSNLLLKTIEKYKRNIIIDMANENDYLFPTSTDIIIKSTQDLITTGFLSIYGEFFELIHKVESVDIWILYANYLYCVLGYPLFDALLLMQLNKYRLPPIFTVSDFDPNSLNIKLEMVKNNKNPSATIIECIQYARNYLTVVQYSNVSPFAYIKQILYHR